LNVAVCYVHPRMHMKTYIPAGRRFAQSYMAHPPGGTPHEVHVVINGDDQVRQHDPTTFKPLPVKFRVHDNWGKDIGAFQKCAREIPADLMVFCGAHVHFRHPGWLDVMVNAYERNGPGLYGAYAFHEPNPHIRTTCFWMPPDLLNAYPHSVGNDFRYEFEHGATHSIVKWVTDMGFNAWMVTWNGTFAVKDWRHVQNHEAVVLDQHSDRIGYR
jgi:hypothetical protein